VCVCVLFIRMVESASKSTDEAKGRLAKLRILARQAHILDAQYKCPVSSGEPPPVPQVGVLQTANVVLPQGEEKASTRSVISTLPVHHSVHQTLDMSHEAKQQLQAYGEELRVLRQDIVKQSEQQDERFRWAVIQINYIVDQVSQFKCKCHLLQYMYKPVFTVYLGTCGFH
jgi:hypothetical protein